MPTQHCCSCRRSPLCKPIESGLSAGRKVGVAFHMEAAPGALGGVLSCRKATSGRPWRSIRHRATSGGNKAGRAGFHFWPCLAPKMFGRLLLPCKVLLDGAVGRGAQIEVQIYPGAYHSFDRADSPRRELPEYRTAAGIVPIAGTDPSARQDVLSRVPAFLARFMMN